MHTRASKRVIGLTANSLSALLLFFSSGCVSVQWRDGSGNLRSAGFIHQSSIDTGQAMVQVYRSAGLNVRLTSFDGGLTLGYRKQVSVHPCDTAGCIPGTQTAMFWTVDRGPQTEGLFNRQMFGAEIGIDPLQNGIRLGYNRQSIVFGPRTNQSFIAKIEFSESELSKTIYLEERLPQ